MGGETKEDVSEMKRLLGEMKETQASNAKKMQQGIDDIGTTLAWLIAIIIVVWLFSPGWTQVNEISQRVHGLSEQIRRIEAKLFPPKEEEGAFGYRGPTGVRGENPASKPTPLDLDEKFDMILKELSNLARQVEILHTDVLDPKEEVDPPSKIELKGGMRVPGGGGLPWPQHKQPEVQFFSDMAFAEPAVITNRKPHGSPKPKGEEGAEGLETRDGVPGCPINNSPSEKTRIVLC